MELFAMLERKGRDGKVIPFERKKAYPSPEGAEMTLYKLIKWLKHHLLQIISELRKENRK